MEPENTGEIQDGRFKPGESGNPFGRPRGSRNKATLAVQELLDGEAEAITRKAIEMAKSGNVAAIRLVMERILPPCKDIPVNINLPSIKSATDIVRIQEIVIENISTGKITPFEGTAISAIAEQARKAIETQEFEARLLLLEQQAAERRQQ